MRRPITSRGNGQDFRAPDTDEPRTAVDLCRDAMSLVPTGIRRREEDPELKIQKGLAKEKADRLGWAGRNIASRRFPFRWSRNLPRRLGSVLHRR